jgi:hypothetical protein
MSFPAKAGIQEFKTIMELSNRSEIMSFVRFICAHLVWLLSIATSNAHSQTFTAVTSGSPVSDTGAWRSVNWVDYDSDGDLDLFVTSGLRAGRNNLLYRNDGLPNFTLTKITAGPLVNTGNRGVGTVSNKSAIGAKARLKATIHGKAVWQRRDVAGQEGYCGQNLRLHFGLGEAAIVDSLIVSWPSGKTEMLTQVAARQLLTLVEGDNSRDVEDQKGTTPQGFRLNQNYPNPFNPATQIEYALPSAERVILRVYDLIGNEIQTLADDLRPAKCPTD